MILNGQWDEDLCRSPAAVFDSCNNYFQVFDGLDRRLSTTCRNCCHRQIKRQEIQAFSIYFSHSVCFQRYSISRTHPVLLPRTASRTSAHISLFLHIFSCIPSFNLSQTALSVAFVAVLETLISAKIASQESRPFPERLSGSESIVRIDNKTLLVLL